MSGTRVSIDGLASAVMKELDAYAALSSEGVRTAVKSAAKTVRDEIKAGAPARSGKYKKSWTTKNTDETASSLEVTVYSKNRYQIAHLLEHGHAKRGGGRVGAQPHIAAAEELGIEQLERDIERCLRNG